MSGKPKISRLALTAFILAGLFCGLTMGVILAINQDLPAINDLENFEPGASTRILSRDGKVISELFVEKRLPLSLDEIPLELKQAVVAVEDRRFHRHPGLDVIRNIGALITDIKYWDLKEGGSTITQQLARNLFLNQKKTFSRKLNEIFLALQIERRYTKEEILRLYLNQIYFGEGAYGAAAAASLYFGKKVSELNLNECALLAGLPQSPTRYSPFKYPERALARRRVVLMAMAREGYIDPKREEQAAQAPLNLDNPRTDRIAPHFVRYVRNQLVDIFGENAVYKGGLSVETTLDLDIQLAAEAALNKGLENLSTKVNPAYDFYSALGSEDPQGAALALEVGSGGILAWVGGADFKTDPFDHITQQLIEPGAAFKPLIYAAAIETGLTQADLVWDAPVSFNLPGREEPFVPNNYSFRFEGEITLRRALEISGNIPAIKVLARIGVDNFLTTARKMGLTTTLARDLTLALGTSEVSFLELVSAYNILAGRGLLIEPHAITTVRDRTGRVVYRATPNRKVALSPETSYIITDMLKGVIQNGTAQRAKTLGRPLAGKPGGSGDFHDALFIGYSPGITAGIWVGFDSGRSLGQGWTGARAALPIWIDFMKNILQDKEINTFDRPAGVVMAPMNRFTGQIAAPEDPGYVTAAFKEGTEPESENSRP